MNKIVATTDFSAVSDNSLMYACNLANAMKAEVVVLHSFIIPVTFSDTPMPIIPIDESREIAEERMGTCKQQLQQAFPGLQISTKIMYGDLVDCLKELSEEIKPELIVMGNSSNSDTPFWMGSNLVHALRHLTISVMGIPAGYVYKDISKICLAFDVKYAEQDLPFQQLSSLLAVTGAKLHVLHIDAEHRNAEGGMPGEMVKIHEWLSPLDPEFHYASGTDIDKGIEEFVTSNNMDCLVVTPHKYSFLEGLFHKSHTKEMVRNLHIPVIAMHKEA